MNTYRNKKMRSNEPPSRHAAEDSKRTAQTHVNLPMLIQRAGIDPYSLTSGEVAQLQRTIGNQALGELLAEGMQNRSSTPGNESSEMTQLAKPVRKDNVIQRDMGVSGPEGFRPLTQMFVDMAGSMGGETAEMVRAFQKDPKMHLYFYGKPQPGKQSDLAGTEGMTLPSIKVDGKWKYQWDLTDKEWETLPGDTELRVEIHIYYNPITGLDKDRSKHFYTLLHEFSVHTQPFFKVFKELRKGTGPKNAQQAKVLSNSERSGQHDDMALGNNKFYEEMYRKTLENIRKMELTGKDTLGVSTEGLVEQRDIDKYTQKRNLAENLHKAANEEITVAANTLQKGADKRKLPDFSSYIGKTCASHQTVK